MGGPGWLAGTFAAVMIATAVYCVSRLVSARRWRRPTEYDVDGVHVLMGVAMAGMLVPRLNVFWDSGWEVIFAAAMAWFGGRAIRGYRHHPARSHRAPHDLEHLLASGAMLYMLMAASARSAGPGPGSASAGTAGGVGVARVTPPLSPRLAACCEIVMGVTMGYVLITML